MTTNLTVAYVKVLYYDRIDVPEGIDVNKTNRSKECMICHCWFFLDRDYKHEPEVCSSCHDVLMMAYELENIAILSMKAVDYGCIIWNTSRSDAVNKLNNSRLDDKRLIKTCRL